MLFRSAFSVIAEGVCIVASAKIPAIFRLRRPFNSNAYSTCLGVERRRAADKFWRDTSEESVERVPEPKTTREGKVL